jgi:DNA-binding HxlR family transcriptional regulator
MATRLKEAMEVEPIRPLDSYAWAVPDIMGIVRDKWSLLLMYLLQEQPLRFSELRRRADPITHKVLTHSLRTLTRYGLVDRNVLPMAPPQVEYAITDLGRSFLSTVGLICQWTDDHLKDIHAAVEHFDAQESDWPGPSRRGSN